MYPASIHLSGLPLIGYFFFQFSRGFLYSFIGLSALEEAYSERVLDMIAHAKDQFHVSWFSLFIQISSWMMLALGIIYMLIGLCCLKTLRDKVKAENKEKWETYREAMRVYRQTNP
jgi:predicted membrane protein